MVAYARVPRRAAVVVLLAHNPEDSMATKRCQVGARCPSKQQQDAATTVLIRPAVIAESFRVVHTSTRRELLRFGTFRI